MFCKTSFTIAVLVSSCIFAPVAGQSCNTDADCTGNKDCTRVGLFRKICAPVSCAKEAAQALLDSGFKAEEFIGTVLNQTGLKERDFLNLDEDESTMVLAAVEASPPPITVFQDSLAACLGTGTEAEADAGNDAKAMPDNHAYGFQWSGAALFSYFGKASWNCGACTPGNGRVQRITNCVGFLAGGDVGLDFLLQVFSDFSLGEERNTQCVPVAIAGPIGVQVCWVNSAPDEGTITEITFGPSFGVALGGFSQCFNNIQYQS
jgi:hypothetical protein